MVLYHNSKETIMSEPESTFEKMKKISASLRVRRVLFIAVGLIVSAIGFWIFDQEHSLYAIIIVLVLSIFHLVEANTISKRMKNGLYGSTIDEVRDIISDIRVYRPELINNINDFIKFQYEKIFGEPLI